MPESLNYKFWSTVRRVIFEGSKFRGCSINFIFASHIFAGRGILATPTKWRLYGGCIDSRVDSR